MAVRWVVVRVLVGILGLSNAAARAQGVIVFGDESYSGVIYRDAAGEAQGPLPALLKYYATISGNSVAVELSPWKLAYNSALAGRGGVIGLSKTPERLLQFDYSAPVYYDDVVLVVLKGQEFPYQQLADLRGKKIGAQLGASFGSEVDQAITQGWLQVERDQRHGARLKKLLHGRIDAAVIGNGHQGLTWLIDADPELQAVRARFVILPKPFVRRYLHLGFIKSMGQRTLLDEFNRIIREGRRRGDLPALEPLVEPP
ncbi:MAG: ABC transporter substrate-binding protein [Pseudomonas sp.]|uniref:substrate-binding periplasmic protein n=1 Tax=Pseudomonas sp. TaxID=306 RepID=UPI0033909ED4